MVSGGLESTGQEERKGGVGFHGDFNGLTWMLLIAATPMYRKMP